MIKDGILKNFNVKVKLSLCSNTTPWRCMGWWR